MHLTLMCLFKKSVNGHIFRGKDRLVKRVSKNAMETLRNEYERQERNMLLLRHPYLTPVSTPQTSATQNTEPRRGMRLMDLPNEWN